MLKPPSPQSAMTWRERSRAWMPLAWPSAVPTAALLNEPMIRCDPLWRIQLADQSVLRPVSKVKTASRAARSPTSPRHRLRMDAILAAGRVGLPVQHLVPLAARLGHLVEERGVRLRRRPGPAAASGSAAPSQRRRARSARAAPAPRPARRSAPRPAWSAGSSSRGSPCPPSAAGRSASPRRRPAWCRSCRCRPSSADRRRA